MDELDLIADGVDADPDYHSECGHYHLDRTYSCPEPDECNDFRCCQP